MGTFPTTTDAVIFSFLKLCCTFSSLNSAVLCSSLGTHLYQIDLLLELFAFTNTSWATCLSSLLVVFAKPFFPSAGSSFCLDSGELVFTSTSTTAAGTFITASGIMQVNYVIFARVISNLLQMMWIVGTDFHSPSPSSAAHKLLMPVYMYLSFLYVHLFMYSS